QPVQTQIKINGTYPLPYKFQVSATFQNLPGAVRSATWTVPNALIAPSLGRNLSSGPNGTASVVIIAPATQYEPRFTQVDLRLTRIFSFGRVRMQPEFDAYNLFNTESVLAMNSTYG